MKASRSNIITICTLLFFTFLFLTIWSPKFNIQLGLTAVVLFGLAKCAIDLEKEETKTNEKVK